LTSMEDLTTHPVRIVTIV